MDRKTLVFRVGYMSSYNGVDEIKNGGEHIEFNQEGGEMWNFREVNGYNYGFVMSPSFAGIDLSRIDNSRKWMVGEECDGVDIIFIAKRDGFGQVVVGWYKNATVFHKSYRSHPTEEWHEGKINYLCQVDSSNAFLVPEDERNFIVNSAQSHGEGFIGQSNVWYPDISKQHVKQFINMLYQYIDKTTAQDSSNLKNKKTTETTKPDKDLIVKIEKAAVDQTTSYFESKSYVVTSVEKDNRGWDLEATKNSSKLLLEVKGHIGSVIQFELTPNEYLKMQEHSKIFRVCVVTKALTSPELKIFQPHYEDGTWFLHNKDDDIWIQLQEKTAAKAFEIDVTE